MTHDYSYYQKAAAGLSFPAAFVDMDLLDQNIRQLRAACGKQPIRIASKSVRCRYILDYVKQQLDHCAGLMIYHGREALWWSEQNGDHLLLGYPVVDPTILQDIGRALKAGRRITLMVDDARHLAQLEELGRALSVHFPVCVDIDLSVDFGPLHFGVWRSPITDSDALEKFLAALEKTKHIRLEGLMGYEAQIAGVGDQVSGQGLKSAAIRRLKKWSLPKIWKWRADAVKRIREKGHPLSFVNGGGTGSIQQTRQEEVVTEITVGSGFFSPHLFDHYQDFQLQPAAFFATQIVRQPKAGVFTCHGGGYLASGSVDGFRAPTIHLPHGARLEPNEGAGEVQTPVFYKGPEALQLGDPVFFRHSKAGELCEHFKKLHLIRNGKVVEVVKTYRGEGQCFL